MKKRLIVAAAIGIIALAMTGCSAQSTATKPTQSATNVPNAAPGPIQYWYSGSAAGTQPLVDRWNAMHPDMLVTATNPGTGPEYVAKLAAANAAGNAPDVANLEYQFIPSFVSSGVLKDDTKYFGGYRSAFSTSGWNSVTFEGKVYGQPRDATPMVFFYRTDLFKKYGLTVPKTWAEFASDAATVHEKDPTASLTSFSPASADAGTYIALARQGGSEWWGIKKNAWTVGIADSAGKKVASFWGDLVNKGEVPAIDTATPQWNAAIAAGTLLSVIGAPGTVPVLQSAAPSQAGLWAAAPLPVWSSTGIKTVWSGGTALVIPAKAKNPAGAAQFIHWMTSNADALTSRVNTNDAFPAAFANPLKSMSVLSSPPIFMANQKDYFKVVDSANKASKALTWGPDVPAAELSYDTEFGAATKNKTSFVDAVKNVQSQTVADMKKSGFPLAK